MLGVRGGTAVILTIFALGPAKAATPKEPRLTAEAVQGASYAELPEPPSKKANPLVLKAEVLLARAHFSPGAMDGVDGDNFRKAIGAYQKANGLPVSSKLDQETWTKLSADTAPVLSDYKLTKEDIRGPYVKRIPAKFEQMSHLKRLGYRDIKEMLGERFHASVATLLALNPQSKFRNPGDTIKVPAAAPDHGTAKAARVVVDKSDRDVEVFGPDNALLAYYPASIGSEEKPAPSGQFEIRRVVRNPDYTYDPAYAFKGVKAKKPFRIAPGPNNPVGAVWMDLSFEGYGIHGTPEPTAIGKTQSHGCIRLTNWDALDLASLVGKGTPVSFQDGP